MESKSNQKRIDAARIGAYARARKLTARQRTESARNAANARWANRKPKVA